MSGMIMQLVMKLVTIASALVGIGSIINAVRLNKQKHGEGKYARPPVGPVSSNKQ